MTVHLVGAGPGSVDLLTVRADRLLRTCQVCCYDRLVDESVLAIVNPDAERIDVGKAPGRSSSQELINELLIALGRAYSSVVRLKGGDPFLFGRGGEEVLALRAAGVACEVVPGVSSALSAPLAAGVPVTHRGLARGVVVVTGHAMAGAAVEFSALANADLTLVVLMGVERRAEIAAELCLGGLSPSTPVVAIERAYTTSERVLRCRLCELGEADLTSPAVIVIGEVAALDLEVLRDNALSAAAR